MSSSFLGSVPEAERSDVLEASFFERPRFQTEPCLVNKDEAVRSQLVANVDERRTARGNETKSMVLVLRAVHCGNEASAYA